LLTSLCLCVCACVDALLARVPHYSISSKVNTYLELSTSLVIYFKFINSLAIERFTSGLCLVRVSWVWHIVIMIIHSCEILQKFWSLWWSVHVWGVIRLLHKSASYSQIRIGEGWTSLFLVSVPYEVKYTSMHQRRMKQGLIS